MSLNLGRQIGVQLSADLKLVEAWTRLRMRWMSGGGREGRREGEREGRREEGREGGEKRKEIIVHTQERAELQNVHSKNNPQICMYSSHEHSTSVLQKETEKQDRQTTISCKQKIELTRTSASLAQKDIQYMYM